MVRIYYRRTYQMAAIHPCQQTNHVCLTPLTLIMLTPVNKINRVKMTIKIHIHDYLHSIIVTTIYPTILSTVLPTYFFVLFCITFSSFLKLNGQHHVWNPGSIYQWTPFFCHYSPSTNYTPSIPFFFLTVTSALLGFRSNLIVIVSRLDLLPINYYCFTLRFLQFDFFIPDLRFWYWYCSSP